MLREDERPTELLQKENHSDFTPDYLPIYPASLSGPIHFHSSALSHVCSCVCHTELYAVLPHCHFLKAGQSL